MSSIKLFLDSDVVIAAYLSNKGAANSVIVSSKLDLFISNYSQMELNRVAKKTKMKQKKLDNLIKNNIIIYEFKQPIEQVRKKYSQYVKDINDAHIVAGAVQTQANFLLTYNLKDYRIDKIRSAFDLLIMQPGNFLQYLRSQN